MQLESVEEAVDTHREDGQEGEGEQVLELGDLIHGESLAL